MDWLDLLAVQGTLKSHQRILMAQAESPATPPYKAVQSGMLLDYMAVLGKATGEWVGMEEEFSEEVSLNLGPER